MTTALKTKCPKCDATFDVSADIKSKPKARARCGQCQHIFFVNDHLQQDEDNMLIDDSLAVGNDEEEVKKPEFDSASVDEMDNWVNQASQSVEEATKKVRQKFARSSVDENSINSDSAGVDDENAWLEKLLQEEQSQVDPNLSRTQTDSKDSDLTKLLSDFGIQTAAPTTMTKQEILAKMNARLKKDAGSKAYNKQHSIVANLFWVLGCLALALLLLAQYVIFNLDSLMKDPEHAAQLRSVCDIASCSLPNADLNMMSISHLRYRPSTVNTSTNNTDIIAALINKSNQDQLYPNLNVKIYGTDAIIGEFIASPNEYLAPAQRLLPAKQPQLFMFTVPVVNSDISRVEITPLY